MLKSIKSQIFIGMAAVIIVILVASSYFVIDQKKKEVNSDIFDNAMGFSELSYERITRSFDENYSKKKYSNFNREMSEIYGINEDISAISIFDKSGKIVYSSTNKEFKKLFTNMEDPDWIEKQFAMIEPSKEPREPKEGGPNEFKEPRDPDVEEFGEPGMENFEHDPLNKFFANKDFGKALHGSVGKLTSVESNRSQASMMSVETDKGRVVYIDQKQGEKKYTNFNGKKVSAVDDTSQIKNIIFPFGAMEELAEDMTNKLSVHYTVNYDSLDERVEKTRNNMIIIALFGIAISLFMGNILANKITSPIKVLTEGALKIGSGKLATRINVSSKSEIGQLSATFNKMAQDLDKSTKAMVEKEKLTHELELAGDIQRELLPSEPPKVKNLDIAASLSSADAIGGDCYDFLHINDDNLILYVGDVTGHGVPAGLVAAINNALVPAFMEHYKTTEELIVHLNKILKEKTKANVFMTMVMAHWHIKKAKLGFTQAGHNPIIYFDKKKKTVKEMSASGMALGMIEDVSKIIKTDYINMQIDDVAILYTDGISEAWKNDKENYGMERFTKSILKNSELKTAQAIHDGILKDVHDFMGSYPQADDITLMVVKRTS